MSDKKNIDRLFQEKFKDFDPQVPLGAWDAIADQLDDKKSRRVIPLWLVWVGAAAGIALLASVFYSGYQFAIKQQNSTGAQDVYVTTPDGLQQDTPYANTQDTPITNNSQKTTAGSNNQSELDQQAGQKLESQVLQEPFIQNRESTASSLVNSTNNTPQQSSTSIYKPQKQPTPSLNNTQTRLQGNTIVQAPPKESKKMPADNPKGSLPVIPPGSDIAVAIDSLPKSQKSLVEVAAAQDKDALKEEESEQLTPFNPSWSATTMFAPVYSSASGSAINDNFADNQKTAGLNLSYGVAVGYQVTPKLSVRAGLHRVDMSYTTNDIIYGVQVQAGNSGVTTLSYNPSNVHNANTPINPVDIGSSFSQEFLIDNTFSGFQGEISQRLGYIEVPLELRYQLIDKKVDIHAIGGLSALFLTENSIAVTDNTARLDLGADDNFNTFNQSANVGLGLDYHFNKSIGLNIEPMFKYQLNPLRDNTANFRPYNIAIYSGITYRF